MDVKIANTSFRGYTARLLTLSLWKYGEMQKATHRYCLNKRAVLFLKQTNLAILCAFMLMTEICLKTDVFPRIIF